MYFFTLDGKIRPIAQIGVGYSSIINKYIPKTGDNDKESYGGLAVNFGGGIAYFLWENISFLRLSDIKSGFNNIILSLKIVNLLNFGNTAFNNQSDILHLKKLFSEPILNSYQSTQIPEQI